MAISALPVSGPMPVPENSKTNKKSNDAERKRGSGNIYLRGSVYWIRYWRRGRQHRESSGANNPDVAQKKLDKRLREIANEREGIASFNPRAEKIYVDELLDALERDYVLRGRRALRQFRTHLKPIRDVFGDMRAVAVAPDHIDDFINRRQEDGRSNGTINRETQLLGQAFKLGIRQRKILSAPYVRRLPENSVREGFFERAEFNAVAAALPEYLQDFARFAFLTAWRKGQIASLTFAEVDRNAGIIVARAEHVKNGKPHKIALEGELAEIIERRWNDREYPTPNGRGISKYVFHRKGQPIRDPRRAWASACEAAGVAGKLFHDLRRSGVRNMVRAGVREGVAMKISGHKTRAIFDRYNIASDDDLRQAVKQTQEYLNTQPVTPKVVAMRKKR